MDSKQEICSAVGRRIKELRFERGLSQEELADISGVHRTYIATLEVGKRNISIATLEKITCGLGVSLGQFFESLPY